MRTGLDDFFKQFFHVYAPHPLYVFHFTLQGIIRGQRLTGNIKERFTLRKIMNIYFDNAAAVPPSRKTLERFSVLFMEYYGNQESPGHAGRTAAKALAEAEKKLLATIFENDTKKRLTAWTASGSESILLAFEVIKKRFPQGGQILYSDFEHPSVTAGIRRAGNAFTPVKVELAESGEIDTGDLKSKLTKDTILVVAGAVQSETGAINDPKLIRSIIDDYKKKKALLFCDAVQALGKIRLDYTKADFITASGQKLGCPASGFLIAPADCKKIISSLRTNEHIPGRLPVPNAVLLAESLEKLIGNLDENYRKTLHLSALLRDGLEEQIPEYYTPTLKKHSPYITHILLKNIQGAIVARALISDGVSVSPGSACASETDEPSAVLKAMGLSDEKAFSALRISFSQYTQEQDIHNFTALLKKVLHNY